MKWAHQGQEIRLKSPSPVSCPLSSPSGSRGMTCKAMLLIGSLPDELDHLCITLIHGKDKLCFE